MLLIVKLTVIVMAIVQGQITFNEPVRAPEPVIVDEVAQTVTEEQVWVQSEVYPDIQVVERIDGQGVPALVPVVPPYPVIEVDENGIPTAEGMRQAEANWAFTWAMNHDLEESVRNNNHEQDETVPVWWVNDL